MLSGKTNTWAKEDKQLLSIMGKLSVLFWNARICLSMFENI